MNKKNGKPEVKDICVDFQTVWDGGYVQCVSALLNLSSGEIKTAPVEIDGLYFADSRSIIIKYENGLIATYGVIEDTGEYYVAKDDISAINKHYTSANKDKSKESKPWSSNYIQCIETDKASLEVYECKCGYHVGFDASYTEQVDDFISAECPSCGDLVRTRLETDMDANQYCVKIDEFTYFYAQGWHEPKDNQIDYAEEIIDIRKYSDKQIESALLAFYGNNLAHLKEECEESWKMLVAEYLFEYSVSY